MKPSLENIAGREQTEHTQRVLDYSLYTIHEKFILLLYIIFLHVDDKSCGLFTKKIIMMTLVNICLIFTLYQAIFVKNLQELTLFYCISFVTEIIPILQARKLIWKEINLPNIIKLASIRTFIQI